MKYTELQECVSQIDPRHLIEIGGGTAWLLQRHVQLPRRTNETKQKGSVTFREPLAQTTTGFTCSSVDIQDRRAFLSTGSYHPLLEDSHQRMQAHSNLVPLRSEGTQVFASSVSHLLRDSYANRFY